MTTERVDCKCFFCLLKKLFIYIFIWLHWILVAACGVFIMIRGPSCPVAHGIFVPQPRTEPTSPALEGGFLTTGPLGKSLFCPFWSQWSSVGTCLPGRVGSGGSLAEVGGQEGSRQCIFVDPPRPPFSASTGAAVSGLAGAVPERPAPGPAVHWALRRLARCLACANPVGFTGNSSSGFSGRQRPWCQGRGWWPWRPQLCLKNLPLCCHHQKG